MTNANVSWMLINYLDLWRHPPELYNIVATKWEVSCATPAREDAAEPI